MAKIISVFRGDGFDTMDMSGIRWLKISEALARRGHFVDMAMRGNIVPLPPLKNLRAVRLEQVKWNEYDVVKTVFHHGFQVLEKYGGTRHPFIISKLGSVVGARDMEGIYFYGRMRRNLFETQKKIASASKYVTVLSTPARDLWRECFGARENVLLVPGGVDAEIPPPSRDPYPVHRAPRILFAGNVYDRHSQPEAHRILIDKLNQLGKLLTAREMRLYLLGVGDISRLDKKYVTYLGAVPYDASWNYLYFANVGIVVSAGKFMHNNESTKIYHYLRVGLPVVSESGFPNDDVVRQANLGFVVPSGDMILLAEKIQAALEHKWNRAHATQYILEQHTWDKRVEMYDRIIRAG